MRNTEFKYGIIENNYSNTDAINFRKIHTVKICAIKIECGCERTNFNILITHDADFGRIYDRLEKKCIFCGQDIRVEFNFNI